MSALLSSTAILRRAWGHRENFQCRAVTQGVSLSLLARDGHCQTSARCERAEKLPWGDLQGSLRNHQAKSKEIGKLEKEGGSMGRR